MNLSRILRDTSVPISYAAPSTQQPLSPNPSFTPLLHLLHLPVSPGTSEPFTPFNASVRPSLVTLVVNEGFIDSGGATSFVQRHPLRDVQAPRQRIHGSQIDAVKSSQSQKKVQAAEKAALLQEGVNAIIQVWDDAIEKLAAQLSMNPKAIRPNTFNALVDKTMIDMNGDLGHGKRFKLKEIQDIVRDGMNNNTYSQGTIDEAVETLVQSRNMKLMGARSSNMAAYADARSTTLSLTDEIVGLGNRTGVTGVALIVKGHIHNDYADSILEFNGSSQFFLDVFNMQAKDVCSKFQQWVCNRKLKPDAKNSLKTMQNECATLIVRGLRLITNIGNVGMNYINYKTSIVQKHHVQLLGWPNAIPFVNPHQITTVAATNALCQAHTVATCKWVVLTKRQQQEHTAALAKDFEDSSVVSKKRKVRVDKGRKRKAAVPTDGVEEGNKPSDGGQDDDDEEDDDDENTVLLPSKKRKVLSKASSSKTTKARAVKAKVPKAVKTATKKTKSVASRLPPSRPKSKEFISSSDESD